MGKVKGEEKLSNEVANKKRKKHRKELDLIRKNLLENQRKLRQKIAPPKKHSSTFNKILNSFADRRQDIDNKIQGFDNKGRRSGRKKICNRLLPSRKPQVGIFANGAKGAEIKRVNLSLNETDRARFEGDLQKVLNNGKRKCKESRSDLLEDILHGPPAADIINKKREELVEIPEKKIINETLLNLATERQSVGKRKGKKAAKNPDLKMEDTTVLAECNRVKSEGKISTDKKWKRSLFQDEIDDFESTFEPSLEQLRFSPIIGQTNFKVQPSQPNVFSDIHQDTTITKRLNFNCGHSARIATKKYKKLCDMVCAENFNNCLQEIPHIDPIIKVKQSLSNLYAENCKKKGSRRNMKPKILFEEELSSNIYKNQSSSNEDVNLVQVKSDGLNVSPEKREVFLGNLKNVSHCKTRETSTRENKSLITKAVETSKIIKNNKIKRSQASSETNNTEYNTSSLDVNYESSMKSCRSEIMEYFQIEACTSFGDLDRASNPRFAGIPSDRKNTIMRYLKEVNNSKPPEEVKKEKDQSSICQLESFGDSANNNHIQQCYLGETLKRNEIRTKQNRTSEEKIYYEMPSLPQVETNVANNIENSLNANCHSAEKCLKSDIGELYNTKERVKNKAMNSCGVSSSILDKIPSDRGEYLIKFLHDVNNSKLMNENKVTFVPRVNVDHPKDKNCGGNYFSHYTKKEESRNISLEGNVIRNEKHVPAILRRSKVVKRNKKFNTGGNVLSKGVLEIDKLNWKATNFYLQKKSPENETNSFELKQNLRKPASTASLFPIDTENSINSKCLNSMKKISRIPQFKNQIETPAIIKAFFELKNKDLKVKLENFMEESFYRGNINIGQQKTVLETSEGVHLSEEFKQQSAKKFRHEIPADKIPISNFSNDRKSMDLPIFAHRQRPDVSRAPKVSFEERKILSSGNEEMQRFPIFLERKTGSKTQKRIRQVHSSPEKRRSKVIIIENPNQRGYGVGNPQGNDAGLRFSKYLKDGQMGSTNFVPQVQIGRPNLGSDMSCNNFGRQIEQVEIPPLCECKSTELENVQQIQLPKIIYQNGMRNVTNHTYGAVQEFGNNSAMSFYEPATFDVPKTCQRMFHRDLSSNVQIPETRVSSFHENVNLEIQRNCNNTANTAQMFDKRIRFDNEKKNVESLWKNGMNSPIINQLSHEDNYNSILSEDKNHNYKYIIEPRYPQAGYKWNQIDQNPAQIHQHVIQPAYNVTDWHSPELPYSYFSMDS